MLHATFGTLPSKQHEHRRKLPCRLVATSHSHVAGVFDQLVLAPPLSAAVTAATNSAAILAAFMGGAAPLRIARSILHSQFLSWTGVLAVPALPPLYRAMVRSLCCYLYTVQLISTALPQSTVMVCFVDLSLVAHRTLHTRRADVAALTHRHMPAGS